VSLLNFLFERNNQQNASVAEASPTDDQSAVAELNADDSLHGEPNIDQIRDELAEIAKLIGPGDSYDMLAETDVNMTTVEISMDEIKKLVPHAFNAARIGEVPNEQMITVLFSDLFDQLQSGTVEATISQLVGEVAEEYRTENFQEIRDQTVALPLQLVVNSVRPEELSNRTTKVERDPELASMPDVFTLPGMPDRAVTPAVPENRLGAADVSEASDRRTIPFTPSAASADEAVEEQNEVIESTDQGLSEEVPEVEALIQESELPEINEQVSSGLQLASCEEAPAEIAEEEETVAEELVAEDFAEELTVEDPASGFESLESVPPAVEETVEEAAAEEEWVEEAVAEEETVEEAAAEEEWIEEAVAEEETVEEAAAEEVTVEEAAAEEVTVEEEAAPAALDIPESREDIQETREADMLPEAAFSGFDVPQSIPFESSERVEEAASLPESPEALPSLADLDRLMQQVERDAKPSEYNPPLEEVPVVSASAFGEEVLVRNLDLNRASAEDLVSRLDGVGPKLAVRIVEDREINGRFTDRYDLARVQGIGTKIFESITGLAWREDLCGRREILANILDSSKDSIPDIKGVAQRIAETKGFEGCVIAHNEGYVLASSWDHSKNEALGAFAPQMFKKVVQYIRRLDLGEMDAFTFFFEEFPITLVNHGDIFLASIHSPNRYSRRHVQIARTLTAELSRRLQRMRDI
jgi:competence ComEA-like helix-hairpin-helix protein